MRGVLPAKRTARAAVSVIALLALACWGAPLWTSLFGIDAFTVVPEARVLGPSLAHPLGTDALGRDVLARLLYGGRTTLTVALLGAIGVVLIGGSLGLAAGYAGGWLDRIVMRAAELAMAVPRLPLMLLLMSLDRRKLFGESLSSEASSTLLLLLVIVSLSWPFAVRISRAAALELRGRPFVEAARALGASEPRILWSHVLPNAAAPLLMMFSLEIAELILYESALSYLGLGVEPSAPSWGVMLGQAYGTLKDAPHLMVFPGFLTFVAVGAFYVLGDALRDVLDPRLAGRERG